MSNFRWRGNMEKVSEREMRLLTFEGLKFEPFKREEFNPHGGFEFKGTKYNVSLFTIPDFVANNQFILRTTRQLAGGDFRRFDIELSVRVAKEGEKHAIKVGGVVGTEGELNKVFEEFRFDFRPILKNVEKAINDNPSTQAWVIEELKKKPKIQH
jgi:hypothetical protein